MRKLILAAALLLPSCTWLEPGFELPTFGEGEARAVSSTLPFISPSVVGSWQVIESKPMAVNDGWVAGLGLEGLPALVSSALANNPDLEAMAGRVKQARAEADIAFSGLLPSVSAGADITRGRASPAQAGLPATTRMPTTTTYGVNLAAVFEVDLFGRVAGEAKTGKLLALAQNELYEDTKLALQAQVARVYVGLLAAQETEAAWADLLRAAEERQAILTARYNAGELDVATWQTAAATLQQQRTLALNAALTTRQLSNALAVLQGKVPGPVMTVASSTTATLYAPAPVVPAGLDSGLLARRPDVRAAAKQLEAANANIGVARASFLPRISLSALGGFASGDLGDLFDWNNRTWAAGPVATLPIFQGGRIRANLSRSWGMYEEGVGRYRAQVLEAYRDVADSLNAQAAGQQQAAGAVQGYDGLKRAAAAAKLRYESGDIGRDEWLLARMGEAQGRMNAAQGSAAAYVATVNLVQGLGGSW